MSSVRSLLGDNLRRSRERLRLTQEQFSEKCGLSASYIGEIEQGKKFPSAEALERIVGALGVQPFQLFLEEEQWEVRDRLDSVTSMYEDIRTGVAEVLNDALRKHLRH
jgi:transcriptional regulator with XRE-family HTH domain